MFYCSLEKIRKQVEKTQKFFYKFIKQNARLSEQFHGWSNILDELFPVLSDVTLSHWNGDWLLHLSDVERAIKLFFAFDRTNYSHWAPLYLQDCLNLEQNFRLIFKEFIKKGSSRMFKHTHRKGRSSRPQVFCQGVLKIFAILTEKHLCRSLFLFLIKSLQHRCFSVNIVKFLRTPFWRANVYGCFGKDNSVPMNHALEEERNKMAKGKGGVIGFSKPKNTVAILDLINHEKKSSVYETAEWVMKINSWYVRALKIEKHWKT